LKRTLALVVLASLPALLPAAPLPTSARQDNSRTARAQSSSQASSHDRHNRHHRTSANKAKRRQHHHANTKK